MAKAQGHQGINYRHAVILSELCNWKCLIIKQQSNVVLVTAGCSGPVPEPTYLNAFGLVFLFKP